MKPRALVAGRRALVPAMAAVLLLGSTGVGAAFRNVEVGQKIENVTLKAIDGKDVPLLRADRKANIFVFFRPGQEYSEKALGELSALVRETADKPVHWVTIVSDRADVAAVKALVASSGMSAPVAIDAGDALWGRLGVALHPSAGFADGTFTLRADQPFNELRFATLVRAHVQHLLGEIDDAALAAILKPGRSDEDEAAATAGRDRNYAEMLFKSGKLDRALERAQAAVEAAPGCADCHALVAAILAAQGNCASAKEAVARALAIDAAHTRALDVQKGCSGG